MRRQYDHDQQTQLTGAYHDAVRARQLQRFVRPQGAPYAGLPSS